MKKYFEETGSWEYEAPEIGEEYIKVMQSGGIQQQPWLGNISTRIPITVLTVGSMQSRFSVDEEIAILTGTDEYAKVFHTRLMNAKCADLNNQELQYGVSHIVYYLDSIGKVQDGVSVQERISKLFEDGTEDEKYLGV